MQVQVLLLVTCYMLFAIASAGAGNFVPILIIVRFIRMVIWCEIVKWVNCSDSDNSEDYFEWENSLNDKEQSAELLRILVYVAGYIGFFPYDFANYNSIFLIVLRISTMAGISYLINIYKLFSYKQKTPALIKHHLWSVPWREVVYISVVDCLGTILFSAFIELVTYKLRKGS